MRVCDWIANCLYNKGIYYVYGLMGGGASGLNDGFIKHGKIKYICFHHEQGAGHAAIGEAKYSGNFSVVNPTTGCGGTNCATSVLDAWQDSVPVLFLSGNVRSDTCSSVINTQKNINIRKYGIQEHNIIENYKSITKYTKFIESVEEVAYELKKAIYIATSGRKGPVWLDIPSNIQTAEMTFDNWKTFYPEDDIPIFTKEDIITIKHELNKSSRPLILAGNGIIQSQSKRQFATFIEKYQIPFVTTYGARDLMTSDHPLNIGAIGIKGSRSGNFALTNCDLLLILGCSLNSSHIGYDPKQFSPKSKKIYLDCDKNELKKNIINIDLSINGTLQEFFGGIL